MTSFCDFYDGLAALDIEGIKRVYTAQPESISKADLPAMWIESPTLSRERSFTGDIRDGDGVLNATIVVAVQPIVMGTLHKNRSEMVTLVDALDECLSVPDLAIGPTNYEITLSVRDIGAISHHAIEANVSAIG